MTKLLPINTAPKNGDWIWLFGYYLGEPKGVLAFWSENDWYDGEAQSNSVTDFGWEPEYWMQFEEPKDD